MIWIIVYLVGLVLSYIAMIHKKREFSDIKLCDVFTILGLSLLSWVALIVDVVIYIFEKRDAVVLKRKEKKNETN